MITFEQFNEQNDYQEYLDFLHRIEVVDNSIVISEGIVEKYHKAVEFIQELSLKTQMKIIDLISLFSDRVLFKIFMAIEWSVKKLLSLVKQGYDLWGNIHDAAAEFINERKLIKFTRENLEEFDTFLDERHPHIKKASSFALAGFLIFEWTSLISFTGNIKFDFDQSVLFKALKGQASFSEVFFSPTGVKMLVFIGTGVGTGLTFPWAVLGGTWTLFAASIVYTIAVQKYPALAKEIKSYIERKRNG